MTEEKDGKMSKEKWLKKKLKQINGIEDVIWVTGYPEGVEVEGETCAA